MDVFSFHTFILQLGPDPSGRSVHGTADGCQSLSCALLSIPGRIAAVFISIPNDRQNQAICMEWKHLEIDETKQNPTENIAMFPARITLCSCRESG